MGVSATTWSSDWSEEAIIATLEEKCSRPDRCVRALWARLRRLVEHDPAQAVAHATSVNRVCAELRQGRWLIRRSGGEPSVAQRVACEIEEEVGWLPDMVRSLARDLERAEHNREHNERVIGVLLDLVVEAMECLGEEVTLEHLASHIWRAFQWGYGERAKFREDLQELLERRVTLELRTAAPHLIGSLSHERLAELLETLAMFREERGEEVLSAPRPKDLWYHEVYGLTVGRLRTHQRAARFVGSLGEQELRRITRALDRLAEGERLDLPATNDDFSWAMNPIVELLSGPARERVDRALSYGREDRLAAALTGMLYGDERGRAFSDRR